MQIIENQSLILHNLLSYKTELRLKDIPEFIKHMRDSLSVLNIRSNNKFIFRITDDVSSEKKISAEILIPIDGEFTAGDEYTLKPVFKLINAVSLRHEGEISFITDSRDILQKYISNNSYEAITCPYYRIIRSDNEHDCIIDIYIGINGNTL